MAGPTKLRRPYVFALLALPLLLAVAFVLLHPTLPGRTKEYVKGIIGHAKGDDGSSQQPATSKEDESNFNNDKWPFQADVDGYELPKFDLDELRLLAPHNYRGVGHEAFATFYASHNATDADPYFVAAQQIVYRLLWHPESKSKHPVVVFVAPFVRQEQRAIFAAAGAIVREVAQRPFEPLYGNIPGRWQDMFSKLEMWRQTDFSRIAYLDSDAFPLNNTDAIFKAAGPQNCKQDKLPPEDQTYAADICRYVFAGHMENDDTVNGGVLVLRPDRGMYERLVRQSQDKEGWDTGLMEQAFLSHAFHKSGPFPVRGISKSWNAFQDYRDQGIPIYILHDKMWAHYFEPADLWTTLNYKQAWADMLKLYESPEFTQLRKDDHKKALGH